MYDLLLKGGTVIDPSRNVHEKLDVGVSGDRISGLFPSIDASASTRVIDVSGKIVAPGLVDNHVHAYVAGRDGQHPDIAGVFGGVTTAADAGGAGPDNFEDFCNRVLPRCQTRIYCLLSIFRDRRPEARKKQSATTPDGWDIDIEGVVRLAQEYPQIVKGIKVQLSARESHSIGIKHIEAAKLASRRANIPVLMHIADIGGKKRGITPPQMVGQAVSLMDPGDTVTHVLSSCTGSTLDQDGKIVPEVLAAQKRGVLMDAAYGRSNFGWREAELLMSQGLVPDSIGGDIDIHKTSLDMQQSLLEYSSFFLHLGFSVDDVLRMVTVTPARFLRIEERAGSLALGRDADIAVIDRVEGAWQFTDTRNVTQVGSQALIPVLTIKSGRVIEPSDQFRFHPWGWAPPTVTGLGVAV